MKFRNQRIFFAANIKFLRERRKLSQEALAGAIGLTRAKLAALEAGHTKAPQPEDYLNFSEYFLISIDSLLKVDLSGLGELKVRELEAGNDIYLKGGNLRVLAISVDKTDKENLEYVPIKAKAGYLAGHSDPEYIAGLPKFSLPGMPEGRSFRMFPIAGDSMFPIVSGSEIVGQYVQDWKTLKPETPCILILRGNQDFVFKLTTLTDDFFLLKSLNPAFTPYTVGRDEVLEIWQFYSYHSRRMPEAEGDIRELKAMVREVLGKLEGG